MSGSSIPYHLRPHKAVDRRLFVDLLGRTERWRPLSEAAYVSMGAYPLEDHKLIHRVLGVTKLIAFDIDGAIVARQHFNRPIETCKCFEKSSSEMIDQLDAILENTGFSDASNIIFWLDYTAPGEIGEQIREFEALLDKLRSCDIVRVTVNAHPAALNGRLPAGETALKEIQQASRLETLKERIGEYLPSDVSANQMTLSSLPTVLARAFGHAALNALPPAGSLTFFPLSIVRYADGQQMLSITGMLLEPGKEKEMRDKLDLANWKFASSTWGDVHCLTVADLTLRERLFLERSIVTSSLEDIRAGLGFDYDKLTNVSGFLESYSKYYRFYPSLLAAEL